MTGFAQLPAFVLLGVCFLWFAAASYRHFGATRSVGNQAIRVLTLAMTLCFTWLAATRSGPAPIWAVASIGCAAAAMIVFARALRESANAGLHVAFTGDGPERLITSGIYRKVRNPLYLSYLLYWTGWTAILECHWAGLFGLAVFIGLYHLAIRSEEAYLSRALGPCFAEYCAQTGRYLPKLRL